MAKRQIVKMVGVGQNSTGFTCSSEISSKCKTQSVKGGMFDMKQKNMEKRSRRRSLRVKSTRKLSSTNRFKQNEGKTNGLFLHIDGDTLQSEQKRKHAPMSPPTACRKLHSYLSLKDFPRLRREPLIPPVAQTHRPNPKTSPFSYREHHALHARAKNVVLPRGLGHADMTSYVPPKFMPSFRELASHISQQSHGVAPVSINDKTPPSMQKWAIEWNKEPKTISIEELKEDIRQEWYQTEKKRTNFHSALDSSGQPPQKSISQSFKLFSGKNGVPTSPIERSKLSTAADEVENKQLKPTTRDHRYNTPDNTILNTWEYNQKRPAQLYMSRTANSFGKLQPKNSFWEQVQWNDKLNQMYDSEKWHQYPSAEKGVHLIKNVSKKKICEPYKPKPSTAAESSSFHGSRLYGNNALENAVENFWSRAVSDDHTTSYPKDDCNDQSSPSSSDEVQKMYQLSPNEDSSFFNWLKLRRHQFKGDSVTKNVDRESKAEAVTIKFPWSRPYRSIPSKSSHFQDEGTVAPRPLIDSSGLEKTWSKVNRNLSAHVVKPNTRKLVSNDKAHCGDNPISSVPANHIHSKANQIERKVQEEVRRRIYGQTYTQEQTARTPWSCGPNGCSRPPVEKQPRQPNLNEDSIQYGYASNNAKQSTEIFLDIAEDALYSVKLENSQSSGLADIKCNLAHI